MNSMSDMVEEIRLARSLVKEIQQITDQYGKGIVPSNVYDAYIRLQLMYQRQLERENT